MPRLDFVKIYDSYHPDLRQQIKDLLPLYREDSRVRHSVERVLSNSKGVDPLIIWSVMLVRKISAREIFRRHSGRTWCYCRYESPRVLLKSQLGNEGTHVLLYRGIADDEEVIIKWYHNPTRGRNSEYENNIYRQLQYPKPCWSTEYFFWNMPVLIMSPLEKLDSSDSPYQVGIDILQQLPPLHQFAIHNDIKPGNVMKKTTSRGSKYLLIDFGGCATEKVRNGGYRRWIWSPKWTCQPRKSENGGREVITFPKHDLIELGHTMKDLYNAQHRSRRLEGDPVREGFTGRLRRYMSIVKNLEDDQKLTPELQSQLISILEGNSHKNINSRNKNDRYL